MICNSNGEDTAGQTGLEVTVPSSFQLKVAWHISRIDSSGTITAYSCPTFTKLSFITRGLSTTATNTVTAVRIGAVAVRGIKVTSTLHNVHFGYYVFLPTEQAETYLKSCVLINYSTYICLCLFGWKVNMILKETVTFKL